MESPNCSKPVLLYDEASHKDCSCSESINTALVDETYQLACRDLQKMANYRQEQNISCFNYVANCMFIKNRINRLGLSQFTNV